MCLSKILSTKPYSQDCFVVQTKQSCSHRIWERCTSKTILRSLHIDIVMTIIIKWRYCSTFIKKNDSNRFFANARPLYIRAAHCFASSKQNPISHSFKIYQKISQLHRAVYFMDVYNLCIFHVLYSTKDGIFDNACDNSQSALGPGGGI